MKFKLKILGVLVMVLILTLLFGGCITTPGKKVTGIVPTDHGTWRLQSAVEREKRKAIQKAITESARSRPVAPNTPSVEGTHHVPSPSAAGKPTPFKPTVGEAKLSPSQALIRMGEKAEQERNVPTIILPTQSSVTPAQTSTNSPTISEVTAPAVKVDWGKLFVFYLAAGISVIVIFVGFDQWRKYRATKDHPIKKNLEKLKKQPIKSKRKKKK